MWIPRPRFAYSLYNFYGATIKIKGSLLKSIASVMRFLLNSLGQISTFLGEKLATGPYSIISIQLTWSFSQNFSLMSGLISICGFTFWYTEPYTQHHRHDTRVSSDVRFDLNLWFHLLIHWTLHTTSQTWHTCIKCCQVWSQSVVSPSDTLNPTHTQHHRTWHTCIKCCQVWSQSVVSPSDTLNPTHTQHHVTRHACIKCSESYSH